MAEITAPYASSMNPLIRMPHEIVFYPGCSGQTVEKLKSLRLKTSPLRYRQVHGKKPAPCGDDGCGKRHGTKMRTLGQSTPRTACEASERSRLIHQRGNIMTVAFGGGSSMDFVKMGAVLAEHPEIKVSDVTGNDKVPFRGLPTIMIPTTAGGGSEAIRSGCILI